VWGAAPGIFLLYIKEEITQFETAAKTMKYDDYDSDGFNGRKTAPNRNSVIFQINVTFKRRRYHIKLPFTFNNAH
jgi:hypothetical protein